MTRTKSAIIGFVFIATCLAIAMTVDYTDTYVADRFNKALAAEQYELGSPFSLDTFLDYYDWDAVCIVTPDRPAPQLKNQFGLPYLHASPDEGMWNLVFVKSYYVVAAIPFKRITLDYPNEIHKDRFERWAAFASIENDGTGRYLQFVGE